jgi:hypothetical protein
MVALALPGIWLVPGLQYLMLGLSSHIIAVWQVLRALFMLVWQHPKKYVEILTDNVHD